MITDTTQPLSDLLPAFKDIYDYHWKGLPEEENQRREAYLGTYWGRFRSCLADCLDDFGDWVDRGCSYQADKVRPRQTNYGYKSLIGITSAMRGADVQED